MGASCLLLITFVCMYVISSHCMSSVHGSGLFVCGGFERGLLLAMTFFENLIPPPTSQSSILYTIAKRHNLHSSDWFIFAHLPHPCPRLRACNRDVLCEAGHSIDRDTLAERSKAVAQGAIPKGRGFEPHRCHFCGCDVTICVCTCA